MAADTHRLAAHLDILKNNRTPGMYNVQQIRFVVFYNTVIIQRNLGKRLAP